MKKKKIVAVVAVGAMMMSASSISAFAYNEQALPEPGQRMQQVDGECLRGRSQIDGMRGQRIQDGSSARYGSEAQLGDGTGYGRGGEGKMQGPGGQGLHDGSCLETE